MSLISFQIWDAEWVFQIKSMWLKRVQLMHPKKSKPIWELRKVIPIWTPLTYSKRKQRNYQSKTVDYIKNTNIFSKISYQHPTFPSPILPCLETPVNISLV